MIRVLRWLITGYWPPGPPPALPPPTCTGCACPPSPLCWDARCRHHCGMYCGCEDKKMTREEAVAIGEYRRAIGGLS